MLGYLVARLIAIIPTVLVLLFFVVVLVRLLPGNAVDVILQEQVRARDTGREELEKRFGLDKPLPLQYIDYTMGVFRGDLGRSVWSREPVTTIILKRIGVTIELGVLGLTIGAASGVLLGVLSAVLRNTAPDYVLRSISILGLSVPSFALATLVIVLPTIWWGWSPPIIYTPPSRGLWEHVSQFFVPALLLGIGLSAGLMRITRTQMLEVLRQDYIRTARAKGLAGPRVVIRHALRNALIPVVTVLGLQVAFLLSGSVLIEQIFGLPGMGRTLLGAISTRDYPLVQGITVVSGLFVIFVNLVVDLSYGILDPRVRGS
jgi:peptide/nickel transport system permease protein